MGNTYHPLFNKTIFILVCIQQLNLTLILLKLISAVQALPALKHTIHCPLEQNVYTKEQIAGCSV